eukprot:CAMPEP_0179485624 /NCGR_PEP_ID=MMETSP0799-20121207/62166_1 /TAXON_ID=46947 /ORGANISM="Geminigera cryophila, Strain CCMP2564" /LENGTH=138 /DNA_ID=CAMNT_0021300045 /DNA_START=1 /DNA_END=415 /DNA_ORIENTATION=-
MMAKAFLSTGSSRIAVFGLNEALFRAISSHLEKTKAASCQKNRLCNADASKIEYSYAAARELPSGLVHQTLNGAGEQWELLRRDATFQDFLDRVAEHSAQHQEIFVCSSIRRKCGKAEQNDENTDERWFRRTFLGEED